MKIKIKDLNKEQKTKNKKQKTEAVKTAVIKAEKKPVKKAKPWEAKPADRKTEIVKEKSNEEKNLKSEILNLKSKNGEYTAKDIYVLKGLEPVRKRPGMYIGSTGLDGLHHLIWEVVDNSLDEAMAGYAKNIEVTLLPNNRVSVFDDGRGIPVEKHKDTGKSALETVMTTLHAGGKFGGDAYKVSGGLHGVGVSVVCALSTFMEAQVERDGGKYVQEYFRGTPKSSVKKVGDSKRRGTTMTFDADPEIFPKIEYDLKKILNHLRQQAYLTQGVRIVVLNERDKNKPSTYTFYFEGGVGSYVRYLVSGNTPRHKNVFSTASTKQDIFVEAAFQYTQEMECIEESFANNIYTVEGGTHISGFRTALTRCLNNYARREGFLKEKEENFSGDDVREGLIAVVSVKIRTPQFEGQTKAKLGNPEAKNAVEDAIAEGLTDYLERNPTDARAIIENCILATKARLAAKAARATVLRKGILEGLALPGKLADCLSKNPEESELYLVEGDSAGGSSKMARDRRFQAILPLRGKILNVERARLDKMLANKEVKSLIIALGTAISEDFNIENLRYHRIIIMTDADSVTADTPIFLYDKEKGEFFLDTVGDFIKNCKDTRNYQVLTYNERSKTRELREIYQTIEHPRRTPLYKITSDGGYSVKVTSDHSVYVYEKEKAITKKGNKIKKGDMLLFPKSLPRQEKDKIIELEDVILQEKSKNVSVKLEKKDIEKIPDISWCNLDAMAWNKLQRQRELVGISRRKMGESIGVYDKVIQQWEQKIDNVMPRFQDLKKYLSAIKVNFEDVTCNIYIPIEEWNFGPLPRSSDLYYGNHSRVLKTKFNLNRDLAYLIGFYLGDGCVAFEKGSPNRFSFCLGNDKVEKYIPRITAIIKRELLSKPVLEKRKAGDVVMHFHSVEFKLLLLKLGLLKKRANEKFIPNLFFNVKKEIQESLLEGLLHSDGYVTVVKDKKGNWGKAIFGWQISSEKLALGILTMLRQFGIFPMYSVRKNKDHIRIRSGKLFRSNFNSHAVNVSTRDYLKNTLPIWNNHKYAEKLHQYLSAKLQKTYKKEILEISRDFIGLKVAKVEKIENPTDNFVYDFSVVGDQNFIAGNGGLLLHNTDGSHIRTLLLTLFYRYFKPIMEAGYIYIAQPPLYKIQSGKTVKYAYNEDQKEKVLKEIGKTSVNIQRYKGLGEMNAEELWNTTMNPENRTLLQVQLEDGHEADKTFDILMGEEVEPRKKFIQTHAKSVKNLDI